VKAVFFNDKLKQLSVKELEEVIAKAISEKLGETVSCNVSQIDHSKVGYSTLEISVHGPIFYDDLKG
jgi:hypothetical protein